MASDAPLAGEDTFILDSVVGGNHVYKVIWNPERLGVAREDGNGHDSYAVCVFKSGTATVGHVPREYSRMCYFFLHHCGRISCEVISHRKKGDGLEVPCRYYLTGGQKMAIGAKKDIAEKKLQSNEKKSK